MTDKDDDVVLLIRDEAPAIRLLTLNRPDKRNALATSLLADIASALENADSDPTIRVCVITGGEKIFAAGADLQEMAPKKSPEALADPRPALWQRIRDFRKPLIAAVEGWCLGAGNELLMCCDLVVAGQSAKFGQPETNLGIIPGAGGTATLMRLVGRTRAMKMVLTGEPITAQQALEAGLVAELAADGLATKNALMLAEKISARAPLAMMQAKAVVKAGLDQPHTAQLAMERQAFSVLFGTEDKAEGVAAFLEKRKPRWQGR